MNNFNFKTTPYQHQLAALEQSCRKREWAYFMEMGTGKSKVAIDNAVFLYGANVINAVLIMAPKGVYANWLNYEIPAHFPDNVAHAVFLWQQARSSGVKYRNKYDEFKMSGGLRLLLVNIETITSSRTFNVLQAFVADNKTMVIMDESTSIKNHRAKRTQAAIQLGRQAVARRILTGSPIADKPLDVYSQCDFLRHGALGFTSFYAFRAHFAELEEKRTSQRTFKVVKQYINLDDLTSRINQLAFVVKKESCLDLPSKIYQTVDVELTESQAAQYETLRRQSILELENEEFVTTRLVVTKLLRLHQLVCGHIADDDGNMHAIPHQRLNAVDEIIEETSGQTVIWATYRYSLREISRHLRQVHGDNQVVEYHGGTSDQDRAKAIKKFQTRKARFFVGNPQTAGYGITLTAGNLAVYYSNSFYLEPRSQSEDRLHRIGQMKSVTYIDLVARGTVDEKILKVLQQKKGLADKVITENWKNLF